MMRSMTLIKSYLTLIEVHSIMYVMYTNLGKVTQHAIPEFPIFEVTVTVDVTVTVVATSILRVKNVSKE